jgi:hypothetical protein
MPDPVFINIGKPPRGMATEINKVKWQIRNRAADWEQGGSNSSISSYAPYKECRRHKKIHFGRIFNPKTDQSYFSQTAKNKE